MKSKSFLTFERPLLTCMVQANNPDRIKQLIDLSLPEGAEAFGMQFCKLKGEYRNEDTYKELFSYSGKPVYVTNYRHRENEGKSEEEIARELLTFAECGATLCDVMGDYFAPCEGELTMDPEAITKQMHLIDELHKRGAEVLMSSHIHKFTPREQVLRVALEHQRRGADICKIVVFAKNRAEEIENLAIIDMLKERLEIPFLFLTGGECRILRRIGASIGNCMSLVVHEYDDYTTNTQPLLRDVLKIRELI